MSDSTALTPQQTFEENIKARLRKDIGDLIPDDVMKAMVEKSMQEMFFKKSRIQDPQRSYNQIDGPSWFESEVKNLLQNKIKELIAEQIKTREKEMILAVTAGFKEHGPAIFANMMIHSMIDASAKAQNSAANIAMSLRGQFPGINLNDGY